MAGPALEFNRPGIEQGLPGYLKMLEGSEDRGRPASPGAERICSVAPQGVHADGA